MTRILIIEDEPAIRRMIKTKLQREGFETRGISDGRYAYDACEEFCPDLVVTDIYMRFQDGLETIRELKKAFPALKIIAMSGRGNHSPGSYLGHADIFGADACFTKPLNWDLFMAAVKEMGAPVRTNLTEP